MTSRPPATPPDLRGYSYQRLLGSGGFADVFLYEQQMPRRSVAVKVLLADVVGDPVRAQFNAEANLMAQVSTHPSIVSIYHADIADDGRPYLVMEYCPRANLAVRYRQERLGVAEALRIGVRLAAAVETAHRTGILHRDIKPANVLTTEYGWPALTDFGISSTVGQVTEAEGMSVPWSAPELFGDPPTSDVRSDVWSLGATVYTLLARRSPFEVPGGRNGTVDLIGRIERDPLPALHRDDIPASFEQALARSMAKRPSSRYGSALALARALQQVEIEMQLAPSTIDVLEPSVDPDLSDDGDDGLTRVRSLVTIAPQTPLEGRVMPVPTAAPPSSPVPVEATTLRPRRETPQPPASSRDVPALPLPQVEQTVRPSAPSAPVDEPEPAGSRRTGLVVACAVVLVGVAVTGVVVSQDGAGQTGPTPGFGPDPQLDDALVATVPTPTELVTTPRAGGAVFTWGNPAPQPGDFYLWRRSDPGADDTQRPVSETMVEVEGPGRLCITVLLVRANGRESAAPASTCTP